MLDFRRHRRVLAHPGPALERRMLSLLAGVVIVMLLIVGAGNPGNWKWFAPPENGASPPQRVAQAEPQVVVALADEDDERPAELSAPEAPTDAPPGDKSRYFTGVRPDYLAVVRDDTVFRPAESIAWFHLLDVLAATPADVLVRASEGPVGYLQLSQQTNEYRGRLVTISGTARAAKLVAAPENAFDIKEYYQLWLQPDRSAGELIVLYCLELPKDFPLGEQLDLACTATGFFFKRWAYSSQGGITTAPLVIAKTLVWQPPNEAVPVAEQSLVERVMTAAIVAAAMAAAALVFMIWRVRGAACLRRAGSTADGASDRSVAATLASLDEKTDNYNRAS
ncbi:MAG: hypothetical protein WD845_11365 [Pirellulales bacterium]